MISEPVFTPFDEPWPESGVAILFEVVNPDYAAERERHRVGLELNPFAENRAFPAFAPRFDRAPADLIDAHETCVASTELTLVVGYPFPGQYAVAIAARSTTGFTRAELFEHIARIHTAMYADATVEPTRLPAHPRITSPRFGEAFHPLADLCLEHVLLESRADGRAIGWVSVAS